MKALLILNYEHIDIRLGAFRNSGAALSHLGATISHPGPSVGQSWHILAHLGPPWASHGILFWHPRAI